MQTNENFHKVLYTFNSIIYYILCHTPIYCVFEIKFIIIIIIIKTVEEERSEKNATIHGQSLQIHLVKQKDGNKWNRRESTHTM